MIRWTYLVPRLLIVLSVVAAIWFGKDPLLWWLVVAGGQEVTGARVDCHSARAELGETAIVLEKFALADPRAMERNLVEGKQAKLQLDTVALSRGRYVVERAELTGLRFYQPRTTPGTKREDLRVPHLPLPKLELAEWTGSSEAEEDDIWKLFDDQLQSGSWDNLESWQPVGEEWIDQLGLETPPLVAEVRQKWESRYAETQGKVAFYREEFARLRQQIENPSGNFVQKLEGYRRTVNEIGFFLERVANTRQEIQQLPSKIQQDIERIRAAAERDRAKIEAEIKSLELSGQEMSELVFSEETERYLKLLLHVLAVTHSYFTEEEEEEPEWPTPPGRRGRLIVFPQPALPPHFLVRETELSGQLAVFSMLCDFQGRVLRLCPEPKQVGEPMEFRIRLQTPKYGDFDTQLVVDRTGETPRDRFSVTSQRIPVPQQTVRAGKQFQVALPESVGSMEFECLLEDGQLQGKLTWLQSLQSYQVKLHESKQSEFQRFADAFAGEQQMPEPLQVNVTLSGTLESPQVKLTSNLGTQLANLLNQQIDAQLAGYRQQADNYIQQLSQAEMNALSGFANNAPREWLNLLQQDAAGLEQVRRFAGKKLESLPQLFR